MELDHKIALVTGGGSGIGEAVAELLAARGARVIAADLAHSGSRAPQQHGPHPVERVTLDVTDEDAVAAATGRIVAAHGRLDVLVTAAGIQMYGTAAGTTAGDWRRVLAVNLDGTFHAVKHALPALRASGAGSIVLISSVQAFVSQAGVAAYTASKGALNALARSVAVDEAGSNVRANAVCPGSVDTPMLRWSARQFSDGTDDDADRLITTWGRSHPLGRVATPAEVAEAVAFLASDRASFITGVALPVDGGLLAQAAVALPQ